MTPEEYQKLLDKHDWYYEYSDDFDVYQAGRSAEQHIISISVRQPELRELYINKRISMFPHTKDNQL